MTQIPNSAGGWAFAEGRNLWMTYCQMKTATPPLFVDRTEAEFIVLADGRRLIDGISSWWSVCHGYNHPRITEAVIRQANQMPHVMFAGLCNRQAERLSQRLARLLPDSLSRVFLCDTGSVAVEVALKIAVQYWLNLGYEGRHKFVSFQNSYHGDTTGAMSVCDPDGSMHAHFKGFLLEQFPAPIPDNADALERFDKFLAEKKADIAGVIIEPLAQMAGGMRFHAPETLAQISRVCQKHGVLFIADEIATGFGRTGTMFAIEQAGICPDIVCLGKALTGGFLTLAATVVKDEVYQTFHGDEAERALMHGPTFMGNPLACAAANASLDLFESDPRLQQVERISRQFSKAADEINEMSSAFSAASLGAILAVSFDNRLPRDATTQWFVDRGIWLRPIRNVIYSCPPFTIEEENLTHLIASMKKFAGERAE